MVEEIGSAILSKVEELRLDISAVAGKVDGLSANYQAFQINYTGAHVDVVSKTDAAHRRLDDHEKKLFELSKALQEEERLTITICEQVKQMKAIMAWIGGAVGVLVVALLWEILTHQVLLTTVPTP